MGLMRSYHAGSFRLMTLLSLLLGALLYLSRGLWPRIAGGISPFMLLALLYAGLFLAILRRSLQLMGSTFGWSGPRSPLFSVFLVRESLILGALMLLARFLVVTQLLQAVLGSLLLCLLIGAFVDNLRLLGRVQLS